MTLTTILLIGALICFALSGIGVGARVNLMAIGLALLTGALLAGDQMIGSS